jgi:hypothetical protein
MLAATGPQGHTFPQVRRLCQPGTARLVRGFTVGANRRQYSTAISGRKSARNVPLLSRSSSPAFIPSQYGGNPSAKWGCAPMRADVQIGRMMMSEMRGEIIKEAEQMPRYIVERTFPDGLEIPITAEGAAATHSVVEHNAEVGVTWVHSYVSDDKRNTFCVYDGPTPEAIRQAAERNGLPVDRITKVSVLDPYFYR